jgi:predicted metal-dependent HD superfamily phosphohydrolase
MFTQYPFISRGLKESFSSLGAQTIISRAYREEHRHYHTLEHLESAFQYLYEEKQSELQLLSENEKATLFHAILFHDFFYQTNPYVPGENELLSAKSASEFINPFLEEQKKLVERLVLITQHHDYSDTLPLIERLMISADLSILTATPEMYRRYAQQIRKEYQHIPDDVFNSHRQHFILSFLEKIHSGVSFGWSEERVTQAAQNLSNEYKTTPTRKAKP